MLRLLGLRGRLLDGLVHHADLGRGLLRVGLELFDLGLGLLGLRCLELRVVLAQHRRGLGHGRLGVGLVLVSLSSALERAFDGGADDPGALRARELALVGENVDRGVRACQLELADGAGGVGRVVRRRFRSGGDAEGACCGLVMPASRMDARMARRREDMAV